MHREFKIVILLSGILLGITCVYCKIKNVEKKVEENREIRRIFPLNRKYTILKARKED